MRINSFANLISRTTAPTLDDLGQMIENVTTSKVQVLEKPISSSEFFKAHQEDIQASVLLEMSRFKYNGENEVEYNGQTYEVYRTYPLGIAKIELYLSERKGLD